MICYGRARNPGHRGLVQSTGVDSPTYTVTKSWVAKEGMAGGENPENLSAGAPQPNLYSGRNNSASIFPFGASRWTSLSTNSAAVSPVDHMHVPQALGPLNSNQCSPSISSSPSRPLLKPLPSSPTYALCGTHVCPSRLPFQKEAQTRHNELQSRLLLPGAALRTVGVLP